MQQSLHQNCSHYPLIYTKQKTYGINTGTVRRWAANKTYAQNWEKWGKHNQISHYNHDLKKAMALPLKVTRALMYYCSWSRSVWWSNMWVMDLIPEAMNCSPPTDYYSLRYQYRTLLIIDYLKVNLHSGSIVWRSGSMDSSDSNSTVYSRTVVRVLTRL